MEGYSILLFDGICNLCTGLVKFIIPRDPMAKFRFAALQSESGQRILKNFDLPTTDFNTFILVENDHYYTKSTAALKMLRHLGGLWACFYVLIFIPIPIRDFFYNMIASRRYQIFGKQKTCLIPTPNIKNRFLD